MHLNSLHWIYKEFIEEMSRTSKYHRSRRGPASVGSELATETVPAQVVEDNSAGESTLLSGILCEIRNTSTTDHVNEEEESVTTDIETLAFMSMDEDGEEIF